MSTQTEWWESFFTGSWLDLVRPVKMDDERTRAEADFIEKVLQLVPQAEVLDVPCGKGRHSLELALRGYQVTAVDVTPPFLDDARYKATERQLEIAWKHRDMPDLPWQEAFDGAFCFGGSFGYFDEEGNAEFLKAVARALKPGARFLVDAHVAETLLPRFQERDWGQVRDMLMLQERRYDHVHSRVDAEWTLVQEDKVKKRSSSIRIYTYRELCRLLEEVGFVNCEEYGSLNQEPFELGSRRLYLVATKRGRCRESLKR